MTGVSSDPSPVRPQVGRLDALLMRLRAPVDGASLAAFRIAFGLVAVLEVYRYFAHDWISRYWVEPEFHFTYLGFGWVRPMPETAMHLLWMVLGFAAIGITLGVFYRASCVVFALGFGYSFLLESARYLNHFYLIALLAALLALVPADRVWSVDMSPANEPKKKKDRAIPVWSLRLIQFQIAVVYIYGGIAKLESDWLHGEPMTTWLSQESDLFLIGPLLAQEWVGLAAAWGGLFFDLFIVLAVAWKRTRIIALLAAAGFHLSNNELFHIGVFPYLAFAGLLLFCAPDWPRALLRRLDIVQPSPPEVREAPVPLTDVQRTRVAPIALALATIFVVVQLTVPLRHVLLPGKSNWTEAGHTFAWHMKLRIKEGKADFVVINPATKKAVVVDPRIELTSWQYDKMAIRPEMLRQYAHHLADRAADDGIPDVKVHARTAASLNNRPDQLLVDPKVDLAAEGPTLGTPSWVVPLERPLP